jgi:hypothetical protein
MGAGSWSLALVLSDIAVLVLGGQRRQHHEAPMLAGTEMKMAPEAYHESVAHLILCTRAWMPHA